MKNMKYLSRLLSFIILFFISSTSIPTTILAAEADTIILQVEANNSGNYVSLNWTPTNISEKYHYTLHSKRTDEAEFQSIPAKSDDIKVLNIYLEIDIYNKDGKIPLEKFTNWKGQTFELPESARLKRWME